MDAPQHTGCANHLRVLHPSRRALRDDLNERARRIVEAAAAKGSGDFVEEVLRTAAASHRRPDGRTPRGPHEAVPLVKPDGGDQDPSSPPMTHGRIGRTDHVWHANGRDRAETWDDLVTKLVEADIDGHKLSDDEFGFFVILLAVAGNETPATPLPRA